VVFRVCSLFRQTIVLRLAGGGFTIH